MRRNVTTGLRIFSKGLTADIAFASRAASSFVHLDASSRCPFKYKKRATELNFLKFIFYQLLVTESETFAEGTLV